MGLNETTVEKFVETGEEKEYSNCNIFARRGILYDYGEHFPMCIDIEDDEHFLINADRYSPTTSQHQGTTISAVRKAGYKPVEIPFSALQEMFREVLAETQTGLYYEEDRIRHFVENVRIVDQTDDRWDDVEYVDKDGERKTRQVHTLGAVLFEYEKRYFLSTMDESGKYWRGNYCLIELPEACETIERTYEILKPKELQFTDIEYERQGEYFFVPDERTARELAKKEALVVSYHNKDLTEIFRSEPKYDRRGNTIRTHKHIATEVLAVNGEVYARKTVRHEEHKMLSFHNVWHRVYVNTELNSWTAIGGASSVD